MTEATTYDHDEWVQLHEVSEKSHDGRKQALWRCRCGTEKVLPIGRVRTGRIQSCGCIRSERHPNLSHGMRHSREYSTWVAMLGRCHSPTHKDYPKWGARGIKVAPEWRNSFAAFYEHIGPRPPGTSIDRIDGNGDYEPGNVRWATALEQAHNRRDITLVDTPLGRMPLTEYARRIGITRGAAHQRLKRGKLEGCHRV